MRKKFKSKRRYNFIPLIIGIIIFFILYYLAVVFLKIEINTSNEKFISNLLNNNIETKIKNTINNLFDPKTILSFELKKENNQLYYKSNNINQNYQVYIYNTHQSEEYINTSSDDYTIKPTVLSASYILQEKLNEKGINTLVEENDIVNYMKKNNMNHASSYKASRVFLLDVLNKYPNMYLYIDLHRDSIKHEYSVITINNKVYAKTLFVLGLENDNYNKNLKNIEKLNNIINNKYNGLSRGIMKKEGVGVNGIYNQDLNENIILIEIGGNENTIEEISNTLEAISVCIKEYIDEKEENI